MWSGVTDTTGRVFETGLSVLEDVGESYGTALKNHTTSSNPSTVQQPNTPIVDNNGNAVTGRALPQGVNNSPLLLIGGGVLVLIIIVILLVRK
ncbi:hypothetical protein DBT82_RS20745 [Vibrio parahaemolyticus]|nr:hypothetical protein [Vibrio parahaemolyticus]EJG0350548.1 hypothetical protein [Vibrio parahaemolyticus]EJG0554092.1 hypothetical protein [Vibrio parahaemolyticus]MCC3821598.1 hypothetical protein [Vibrio parahaemolyticus]HAS6490054.1 hypothetical protein [Vibrio parahaemolyticus]